MIFKQYKTPGDKARSRIRADSKKAFTKANREARKERGKIGFELKHENDLGFELKREKKEQKRFF